MFEHKQNIKLRIEKINVLLKKRQSVYPVRDETFDNLSQNIDELTHVLISAINNKDIDETIDQKRISQVNNFIDKPIFVCGGMKTGTTLLTQLLDNHPSLIVFPGDGRYFRKFFNRKLDFEDTAKYVMQIFVNPSGKEPFWYLGEDIIVYLRFLRYLKFFMDHYPGDAFIAIISSLFCIKQNGHENIKSWVEKTPGNEFCVNELYNAYPKAKFIHIIRDPLVNISSLKRLHTFRKIEFSVQSYVEFLKNIMNTGFANKSIYSNSYKIVRYEDIVQNPSGAMKSISSFINIPFTDTLLIPTEYGKSGKANSMYKNRMVKGEISNTGINDNWKSELNENEISDIVNGLYKISLKANYNTWQNKTIKSYLNKRYRIFFKQIATKLGL